MRVLGRFGARISNGCRRSAGPATADICYFFSVKKANWSDAETECISYSGHLASVGSAFENNFLQTQAKKAFSNDVTYYLGGSNMYNNEYL